MSLTFLYFYSPTTTTTPQKNTKTYIKHDRFGGHEGACFLFKSSSKSDEKKRPMMFEFDDDDDDGLASTDSKSTATTTTYTPSQPIQGGIFKRRSPLDKTTTSGDKNIDCDCDLDSLPPMKKRRVARSVSFSSDAPSCFYPPSITPEDASDDEKGSECSEGSHDSRDSDDTTPPCSPRYAVTRNQPHSPRSVDQNEPTSPKC